MRFRVSLNVAWQSVLLLVAVVPVVLALPWAGSRVFDLLLDERLAHEADSNHRISNYVDFEVRRLVTLAENKSDAMTMVRQQDLREQEVLRTLSSLLGTEVSQRLVDEQDFERITQLMDNIADREPAVVSVVLTDPQGAIIAGLYRDVGEPADTVRGAPPEGGFTWTQAARPPFLAGPLNGQPFVGSARTTDASATFVVVSPVAAGGALVLQVDVHTLWQGGNSPGESTVTYAVNENGALLHGPPGTAPGTPLTSLEIVQLLASSTPAQLETPYQGLGGEPVFGLARTIESVGWGVVTEIPVAQIVTPIRAMVTRISLVVALVFAGFAGFGAYLVSRVLRPVSDLSLSLAQATEGDYAQTRIQTVVREIDQLAQGFNAMVAMVGRRESQLVEAHRMASLGHWEWSIETGELRWSDQIFDIYGTNRGSGQIDHERFLRMIHPDDRNRLIEAIDASTDPDTRAPYSEDHRICLSDGEIRIVHSQGEVTFDEENHRATRMVGTAQDITARVQMEEERNTFSRTLQAILDNSPFGIWMTDMEGRPQFANETLCHKIGRTMEDVLGAEHIGELFDAQIHSEFSAFRGRGLGDPRMRSVYATLDLPERGRRDFKITRATIPGEGADIQGFIGIVEDVTEARRLEDQLAHQATHDSLTGLLNRAAFEQKLEQVCRTVGAQDTPHALCFIDLDRFKVVNDTCGHHAGDELLRQLSALYGNKCRKTELTEGPDGKTLAPALARLGGDEFGLLLYNCPPEQAVGAAQRLVDLTREFRFTHGSQVFDVGCTIGVAPIEFSNGGAQEVMKNADGACLVAKEKGRGRAHLFLPDDADVDRLKNSVLWAPLITRALEEDGLELFQQAIIPVQGDELGDRFEVLVRYRSSSGEIVPPGAFLPAAERFYLMPRIDRWVVENTFAALERIYSGDSDRVLVSASINLSGQTLGDSALLSFIFELFERSPIRPEQICFEITETAAVSNLEEATYLIDRLRDVGCRFALDDFGSGLSSFSFLHSLNVDALKIDGSLVRNIVSDPVAREMVSAIKRVGDVMGIRTVGEWVEDEPTLDALRGIGVDFGQGYGLTRPAPLADLAGGLDAELRTEATSRTSG